MIKPRLHILQHSNTFQDHQPEKHHKENVLIVSKDRICDQFGIIMYVNVNFSYKSIFHIHLSFIQDETIYLSQVGKKTN